MSKTWWRVSCEEIGPTATESVLAIDACTAAAEWAEGRGTDSDAELLVEVTAETGDSGVLMGDTVLFRVRATVRWSAVAVTCDGATP